jgi:hypothetical protein
MTEAEWLWCEDPRRMVDEVVRVRSERKLRLFAVAWCRRAWPLLGPRSRRAAVVEASEAYADGMIAEEGFYAVVDRAQRLEPTRFIRVPPHSKAIVRMNARFAVAHVAMLDIDQVLEATNYSWVICRRRADVDGLMREETRERCRLLREIFGNPFRPTVFDRAWLLRNGGTAL